MMKERSLRMEMGDRKRGVERIEEEKMAFKEEMRISHKTLFTRRFAKLRLVQMVKIFAF